METLLEKLFSVYGPTAIGWMFAILMWWDCREARKSLEKLIGESTATLTTLTTFLQGRGERRGD